MGTYLIRFKHIVEQTYTAKITAETADEALGIFEEETFDHLIQDEPEDEQGLNVEIIEVTEEK